MSINLLGLKGLTKYLNSSILATVVSFEELLQNSNFKQKHKMHQNC